MKVLFTSAAALLFVTSSSLAGVTYDFSAVSTGASSGTITGSVKAEGTNIRLDIRQGDGVLFANGAFVVSTNGGRTMHVVNPATKTFYLLNLEEVVGSADSLLQSLGGNVKIDVRNPKVSVVDGGAGGKIAGFETKKSTVNSSYEIAVEGLGRPMSMNMQLSTDVWWTNKLSAEFTNFLQMRGLRTGLEAVDKLIEAERGTIKGFPLKQITTTRVSFAGNDMTSTTTSTVSNVKRARVPVTLFAVPAGFTRVESPIAKMMSGLGARR